MKSRRAGGDGVHLRKCADGIMQTRPEAQARPICEANKKQGKARHPRRSSVDKDGLHEGGGATL